MVGFSNQATSCPFTTCTEHSSDPIQREIWRVWAAEKSQRELHISDRPCFCRKYICSGGKAIQSDSELTSNWVDSYKALGGQTHFTEIWSLEVVYNVGFSSPQDLSTWLKSLCFVIWIYTLQAKSSLWKSSEQNINTTFCGANITYRANPVKGHTESILASPYSSFFDSLTLP